MNDLNIASSRNSDRAIRESQSRNPKPAQAEGDDGTARVIRDRLAGTVPTLSSPTPSSAVGVAKPVHRIEMAECRSLIITKLKPLAPSTTSQSISLRLSDSVFALWYRNDVRWEKGVRRNLRPRMSNELQKAKIITSPWCYMMR